MAINHVIIIHGGSCWTSYGDYIKDLKQSKFEPEFSPKIGWQKQLQKNLGSHFKVLHLEMPNWRNAKYQEWKIWFEKAVAASGKTPIVVGHSLGGIFLAKYFSENNRLPKVKRIYLISAPYQTFAENPDFGDFALKGPPHRLKYLRNRLSFYHSEDDPIVEIENLDRYREVVPEAIVRIFRKRGHFEQPRFSELAADIKSLK